MTSEVIRQAALEWVKKNTTFDIAIDPLPASVEMFIAKYEEIMNLRPGVYSESISGLSQSFKGNTSVSDLLKQYAAELIGEEYVISDVRVVVAEKRWK